MKSQNRSTFSFSPKDIELSLDKTIEKIDYLISESLKLSRNPLLLFSGGSDSLLLLAFLLRHKPDIKVFYIDMRMNFPEYEEMFNKKIKPLIKDLHYCKIDYGEKDFIKNFGIPIYPGVEEIGYTQDEFEKLTSIFERACP